VSGRKSTIIQFKNIINGDMSQSSVTSSVTNIITADNLNQQLQWSGSPVGTFALQVSGDYEQDMFGNVQNAGTWVTLTTLTTAGGNPAGIDLQGMGAPWYRVVYTKTSGSGTLQGFLTGKML